MPTAFPPAIRLEPNVPQWLLFRFSKPLVKNRVDKPGEVSIRFGAVKSLPDQTETTLFVNDQETAELITSMLERCRIAGMPPALCMCKYTIPGSKRHFMAMGTPEKVYWESVPPEILDQDGDGNQTVKVLEPPKTFFDAWSAGVPAGGVSPSAPRLPYAPTAPKLALTASDTSSAHVNGFLTAKNLIAEAGKEIAPEYAEIFKSIFDTLHAHALADVEKALGEWVEAQEMNRKNPDDTRAIARASSNGDVYAAAIQRLENIAASVSTVFIQLMNNR